MMKKIDIYEKAVQSLMEEFQAHKGKGYCYIYPPANPITFITQFIQGIKNKRSFAKILVVVEDWSLVDKCKSAFKGMVSIEDYDNFIADITFLSTKWINTSFNYKYTFGVTIGLNNNYPIYAYLNRTCQFILGILTKDNMNVDFKYGISHQLPLLNVNLDESNVTAARVNTPVNEYRIPLQFTEADKEIYDKYNAFIKSCNTIFGGLDNITKCRIGDKDNGISAMDFRYRLAINNGWSEKLDTNTEFNRQIDEIYNPVSLYQRAESFFNITRARRELVMNNENKFNSVLNIIKDNITKKILVVCKDGNYANKLMKYLNNAIKEYDKKEIAGCYHDEVEARYFSDNFGNPIVYKSGKHKGEPRLFKSAIVSTYFEELFNSNEINVLIIKESSNNKLLVNADIIIYTSSLLADIFDFKKRYVNVTFTNNITTLYKIFYSGSIEEDSINREIPSTLVSVHENSELQKLQLNKTTNEVII